MGDCNTVTFAWALLVVPTIFYFNIPTCVYNSNCSVDVMVLLEARSTFFIESIRPLIVHIIRNIFKFDECGNETRNTMIIVMKSVLIQFQNIL